MHDGSDQPPVHGPPLALSARRRGLTGAQMAAAALIAGGVAAAAVFAPDRTTSTTVHSLWTLFLACALWRLIAIALSRPSPPPAPTLDLPPYAVIAALRH